MARRGNYQSWSWGIISYFTKLSFDFRIDILKFPNNSCFPTCFIRNIHFYGLFVKKDVYFSYKILIPYCFKSIQLKDFLGFNYVA